MLNTYQNFSRKLNFYNDHQRTKIFKINENRSNKHKIKNDEFLYVDTLDVKSNLVYTKDKKPLSTNLKYKQKRKKKIDDKDKEKEIKDSSSVVKVDRIVETDYLSYYKNEDINLKEGQNEYNLGNGIKDSNDTKDNKDSKDNKGMDKDNSQEINPSKVKTIMENVEIIQKIEDSLSLGNKINLEEITNKGESDGRSNSNIKSLNNNFKNANKNNIKISKQSNKKTLLLKGDYNFKLNTNNNINNNNNNTNINNKIASNTITNKQNESISKQKKKLKKDSSSKALLLQYTTSPWESINSEEKR